MSLKPMEIPPVPEETARVARAAFPKGAPFLDLGAKTAVRAVAAAGWQV
jgi:hypothetical protein